MKDFSAADIAPVLKAQLQGNGYQRFRYLATDSRKISFPDSTLFIALPMAHRNGHHFAAEAYRLGVRVFLVSEPLPVAWHNAAILMVPDTLAAMQQLAAWRRHLYAAPVVGIGGSNGKTIVKEWLNELLQADENIVRSPKSFNSQIGVPHSVWMMHDAATLGIFEAGISRPGEMTQLEQIINPDIGIFTMLGDAHTEGFDSDLHKLEEKFILFRHCKALICHTDDVRILNQTKQFVGKLYNWGFHAGAWLQLQQQTSHATHTQIAAVCNGNHLQFDIPFTDAGSVENALHCVTFMLMKGYAAVIINERLQGLHRLDMRLQWKKAIHQCYLLNDSYSNDFTALQQAMDYWTQQSRQANRTLILSDLSVPKGTEQDCYQQLAGLLQQKKVQRLIAVGPALLGVRTLLERHVHQSTFFPDTSSLLAVWPSLQFGQEDILLKGARPFAFEKIATLLQAQVHQTELEINLHALQHNLQSYKSRLAAGTKIMVMVKAFGYGSGDAEVARTLQYNGVDYLAVAYADEAVSLRQAGVSLPIMVLNADEQAFETLEQYNAEPEIYSFEILQRLLHWCKEKGWQHFPIHLKIDTGMHRLGFSLHEVEELARQLAQQEVLTVKSVFTHLVASEDEAADAFTRDQLSYFETACQQLQQHLRYPFLRHAANTAAIHRHPSAQYDMVRLGVGLYGGGKGMEPVMQLHTTVSQVKEVKAGETVGYGRHGRVNRDSIIATVSIGYADGYRRCLSNGVGAMMVRGKLAPVIGLVCMDMTMLDVTDIPGVQAGDRVEVIGKHLPIDTMAVACNTISYDIMTGISQRVKRVYMAE